MVSLCVNKKSSPALTDPFFDQNVDNLGALVTLKLNDLAHFGVIDN